MSKAQSINDQTFQSEVLDNSGVVLVDFWAPWCGPCRMLAPVIDQLADSVGAKAKIVKADVADVPNKAREMGINSIPSLMVFKGGKLVDKAQGVHSLNQLENLIKKHL